MRQHRKDNNMNTLKYSMEPTAFYFHFFVFLVRCFAHSIRYEGRRVLYELHGFLPSRATTNTFCSGMNSFVLYFWSFMNILPATIVIQIHVRKYYAPFLCVIETEISAFFANVCTTCKCQTDIWTICVKENGKMYTNAIRRHLHAI